MCCWRVFILERQTLKDVQGDGTEQTYGVGQDDDGGQGVRERYGGIKGILGAFVEQAGYVTGLGKNGG